MSYYVYIIQSLKDNCYYKGFTEDPIVRLQHHNNGDSTYTSYKMPWQLIYLQELPTKKEAFVREKMLKKYSHQQILRLISTPLNILSDYLNRLDK